MTARFVTRPDMWAHNNEISQTIRAERVELTDEHGVRHDGVGIFSLGKPRQMLTPEAAYRLAHDLADALDSIQINPRPEHNH